MVFPRQEPWSGFLFPSPGDLPDPGIEPGSPALEADSLGLSHQGSLGVYVHGQISETVDTRKLIAVTYAKI